MEDYEWWCRDCGAEGTVKLEKSEDLSKLSPKVKADHRLVSKRCDLLGEEYSITVRGPRIKKLNEDIKNKYGYLCCAK